MKEREGKIKKGKKLPNSICHMYGLICIENTSTREEIKINNSA